MKKLSQKLVSQDPRDRSMVALVGLVIVLAILFVILGVLAKRSTPAPEASMGGAGDAAQRAAEFLRESSRTDISTEEREAAAEYLQSTAPAEPDTAKIEQISEIFGE